ncbi:MAG: O-antigen ligase family protein [Nitrospirota bacterium]|nr:O-antigen ligase family protein [Nitrospirota bacterium]
MPTTSSIALPSSERVPYFDTVIRVVLAIYIAVLPFKPLLVIERNGFVLLLGLLLGWCVTNRRLFYSRTPYDMLLLAFVVWVGLTIPFSVAPSYSVKEYGKLLQHMVVFYAVIHFFKGLLCRQVLLGLIGIMTILVAGYGLSQFNLRNPQAVVSFLPAEVWLTTFLVMVIPFGLAVGLGEGPLAIRTGGALTVGLMTVCLIATQSRAGLVALVAELWVMAWFIRSLSAKIVAALATIGVIAAVMVVFNASTIPATGLSADITNSIPVRKDFSSVIHRFDIWGFTLSEIAKHWLVGIGYGSHSYLLVYGQDQEVVVPGHAAITHSGTHNIFLYLALHVGLPGMLLFGWFFVRVVQRTSAEYRHAHDWLSKAILVGSAVSVVGLILRLQFDQMLVGSLAVLFWVLLAMAVLSYPSYNHVAEETRVQRSGALTEV